MIIRNWKFEDVLRISELEKECFPAEPWSYRTIADVFGNHNFIGVVAEEGEVVGYAGLTMAVDTADIENIAVYEPYRKSGLATKMLQELLAQAKARGVQRVFLEVRVSNATAMKMYLRCGFVGVYARLRYYKDGEDCLVMAKEL